MTAPGLTPAKYATGHARAGQNYQKLTGLSAVATLDVPPRARCAMLAASSQGIRIRDDGTAPTSAEGFPLAAGSDVMWTGELTSTKIIEQSASATVYVHYYR